jgi:hypothetical protein
MLHYTYIVSCVHEKLQLQQEIDFVFTIASRPAVEPKHPRTANGGELYSEINRPAREVDRTSLPCAEIMLQDGNKYIAYHAPSAK